MRKHVESCCTCGTDFDMVCFCLFGIVVVFFFAKLVKTTS